MNYYRKPINKIVDNVKLKMQLGALTLKLSENNNKIDDLIGADKNIKKDVSSNTTKIDTYIKGLNLINTNTSNNSDDILSNLKKINDNKDDISSNLERINDNKDDIIALQTSNVKAFYNLDQIFIYDILKKDDKTVDKNNYFNIFEKEIIYNFVKNSYLEIALKILTKISHYALIGYFQILCNFYDQDNNLFYTISLSTAAGSINTLSTIKSVFIVPINEHMSKIKIDFFITPIKGQEHRSAQFIIKDINSNKIYIKYFQKTDEMSIKDIQDALDNNGKNIDSEQVNTNTTDIADNSGKIGINTGQINTNTTDIADNLGKIGINTVGISDNLNEITNITKTFMLKNIYFTDFDSVNHSFTNELLYFHHKDYIDLSATIKQLNMEYSFKKDDYIEIECKLMISHNSYEDSKNNLSFHYSLYDKNLDENNLLFKEIRDYGDFPLFNENRSIIKYIKICYRVKNDTSNIIFTATVHSKTNKLHLLLYHHIIEHGVNYISVKHYGKS